MQVSAILDQLGLDRSLFYQIAIFTLLFFLLSNVYFKPFLKLFEVRHKRLVQDREAAEKLVTQANAKFDEYRKRISEERSAAKKEYEALILETKKDEALILADARNEAKKISQAAAETTQQQRELLRKQLEVDVEGIAKNISDMLLVRRD